MMKMKMTHHIYYLIFIDIHVTLLEESDDEDEDDTSYILIDIHRYTCRVIRRK